MDARLISHVNSHGKSQCPDTVNWDCEKEASISDRAFSQSFTSAAKKIDFDFEPDVGTVLLFKGQLYQLTGAEPHVRIDGSITSLLCWRSYCADCGVAVTFRTPLKSSGPSRRCQTCAKKGVRV